MLDKNPPSPMNLSAVTSPYTCTLIEFDKSGVNSEFSAELSVCEIINSLLAPRYPNATFESPSYTRTTPVSNEDDRLFAPNAKIGSSTNKFRVEMYVVFPLTSRLPYTSVSPDTDRLPVNVASSP